MRRRKRYTRLLSHGDAADVMADLGLCGGVRADTTEVREFVRWLQENEEIEGIAKAVANPHRMTRATTNRPARTV